MGRFCSVPGLRLYSTIPQKQELPLCLRPALRMDRISVDYVLWYKCT